MTTGFGKQNENCIGELTTKITVRIECQDGKIEKKKFEIKGYR